MYFIPAILKIAGVRFDEIGKNEEVSLIAAIPIAISIIIKLNYLIL